MHGEKKSNNKVYDNSDKDNSDPLNEYVVNGSKFVEFIELTTWGIKPMMWHRANCVAKYYWKWAHDVRYEASRRENWVSQNVTL